MEQILHNPHGAPELRSHCILQVALPPLCSLFTFPRKISVVKGEQKQTYAYMKNQHIKLVLKLRENEKLLYHYRF